MIWESRKKIKSVTVSIVSPSIYHEVMVYRVAALLAKTRLVDFSAPICDN